MSPAPGSTSESAAIDGYAAAWGGLMHQVRNGYSWSGGERNRLFINGARGRFYDGSAVSGLDFPDDGRGIALVDWDQDGKLDLWMRNRTAPRLRLMKNMQKKIGAESVAITLEGVNCNRDGIGAVVELKGGAETPGRLVRSVRAGDLFLSQSSKTLHFGTTGFGEIENATVLWPGGEKEVFTGVSRGGRFILKQGSGKAEKLTALRKVSLSPSPRSGFRDDGAARVLLPSRVPFPAVAFRDQAARAGALAADGKSRLVMLWSGTCPHCKGQLRDLAKAADQLSAARLEILALAVDGMEGPAADTSASYDMIDETGFPFPWGLIDAPSAERIHGLQAALFDRTPASSVPLGILLDERGQAVAIYRGQFLVRDLLEDLEATRGADKKQLYHLAPPLKGRWFTNPLPQSQVSGFLRG